MIIDKLARIFSNKRQLSSHVLFISRYCLRLLIALVTLNLYSIDAISAEQHALVIGNSQYSGSPLLNPRNDALDMVAELKKLNYQVYKDDALLDLDRTAFERELLNYARSLPAEAVSLIYYAGHGISTTLDNFLIPIDARLEYPEQLKDRTVSLRSSVELVNYHNPDGFNIFLLDACRDNPLSQKFSRSTRVGLTRIGELPRGSFIGYAADTGQLAADGTGRNGLYTSELLSALKTMPDLPIETVHKRVASKVVERSNGEQFPVSEQKFVGEYCFGLCEFLDADNTAQTLIEESDTATPASDQSNSADKLNDTPSGDISNGPKRSWSTNKTLLTAGAVILLGLLASSLSDSGGNGDSNQASTFTVNVPQPE